MEPIENGKESVHAPEHADQDHGRAAYNTAQSKADTNHAGAVSALAVLLYANWNYMLNEQLAYEIAADAVGFLEGWHADAQTATIPAPAGQSERKCGMHGEDCINPTAHHFLKYHDPKSGFYLGKECVNCCFGRIEREVLKALEESCG
jgi:hypothetical protein